MFSRFKSALFSSAPATTLAYKSVSPTTPSAIQANTTLQSISSSATSTNMPSEIAYFANGCFWGTDHIYRKYFGSKGLKSEVGYMGGDKPNPNYREVCTGTTGHAEAVKLEFDPAQISYAELVEFFYRSHDPTHVNRQGPDVGPQYRSVIFPATPEQSSIAEKVTKEVQAKYFDPKEQKIATEIVDANKVQWWRGEDYHQLYLDNNPSGYHCPTHRLHW